MIVAVVKLVYQLDENHQTFIVYIVAINFLSFQFYLTFYQLYQIIALAVGLLLLLSDSDQL